LRDRDAIGHPHDHSHRDFCTAPRLPSLSWVRLCGAPTPPVGVLSKCMGVKIVRCASVGGMEGGREKLSGRSDSPVRVASAVLDSRRAGLLPSCLIAAWLGSRKSCFAAVQL